MRALLIASIALCSISCVQVSWNQVNIDSPMSRDAIAALAPGETDLAECLTAFGAPLVVWEFDRDGVAIAYGHFDSRQYGVSVSVPVESNSLSMSYADLAAGLDGLVLLFDTDLVLSGFRQGELGDLILQQRMNRPSYHEDE